MKINKLKFKDIMGRPLTQSLFLEVGYECDKAVYTLKDEDYEYKGVVYPSLKRLYLEYEDPVEYDFANEYLLGWNHWQRLKNNKTLQPHFTEWEYELELKLRSQGIRDILDMSANGSFQASKFIADRGWEKRGAGRPSKEDKIKEDSIQGRIMDEYGADFKRMGDSLQ